MASSAPFHRVLVDTGPLVALLRRNDVHHELCSQTLRGIRPPLLTCWPVVTEAAWLLRGQPRAIARLYEGPKAGVFQLLPLGDEALDAIAALAKKDANLRPQLADLALVHLAERERLDIIFTLDRRDFSTLRRKGRKAFRLLPESF